jgi:hypothetical protein
MVPHDACAVPTEDNVKLMPARGKRSRLANGILFVGSVLLPRSAMSQAIPVELMTGLDYGTINLVVSKGLTGTSRWGFFHQSTLTAAYGGEEQDDLAMQQLLFFEPVKGLRLTGGAFYGKPGFNPTAGMQYVNAGRVLFILLSPRVNIESEPSFSVFSILRYKPSTAQNTRLYLGMQALNTFDASNHIKSYQWLRVGLDRMGTQAGVAVNFDEFGPHPDLQLRVGLFVRREIP